MEIKSAGRTVMQLPEDEELSDEAKRAFRAMDTEAGRVNIIRTVETVSEDLAVCQKQYRELQIQLDNAGKNIQNVRAENNRLMQIVSILSANARAIRFGAEASEMLASTVLHQDTYESKATQ